MAIQRHIVLILFILCIFAAPAQAQLSFNPAEWDFGTIHEADGRVSHTFTGVNRSNKPLVILDVVSSCGCAAPEFSQQPILPGGKTQIKVTFDPTNRPGVFIKELGVYSSEREKVATLTLRGNVTPRPKTTEELYPVDTGGGLRLSSTLCAFSYIYEGRRVQATVSYANTSSRTLFLELRPQQQSGLLAITAPRQIAPGERGEINLSYLIPAGKPRYGTLRDVWEVLPDGRGNGTLLMAHAIGVDPADDAEKPTAPKAGISENILKFGPVKHAGPIRKLRFTITNEGGGELIVRAVEHQGRFSTTLTPGMRIAAGGSYTAEVALDPARQEFGIMTDHLIVITNDPIRPMRRVRVSAIIEDN